MGRMTSHILCKIKFMFETTSSVLFPDLKVSWSHFLHGWLLSRRIWLPITHCLHVGVPEHGVPKKKRQMIIIPIESSS